jgi:uncharacterized protein with HEPN domain
MLEVKATKQGTDREVVAMVDLGDNLQDAIEKFGEEVVFTNFQAQAKIRAQAIMRDMLTAGRPMKRLMSSWPAGSLAQLVSA